jgi:membrane protein YfhO
MPRPDLVRAAPPAPRFALGWVALVYALCVLSLGYPALSGGFLVSSHSDQYLAGYAFREFAARSLRAGQGFPLWNPYLFGGVPFVAAMAGDIFYPTFLLRMVMPTDIAMTWSFILHLYLAGVFTYAFLRAMGFGFYPSLIGGIAYMMSGQIASLVSPGHDGKLYISALFPLMLWAVLRGVRDGSVWAWGCLALVTGLAVLTPHPQLLQYLLLASGAFALYAAFGTFRGIQLERSVAMRRLGFAFGAVLLGGVIGAIQYLPVMEYVAWSPRAGGLASYELATSYSHPPEELLNLYLPQFSGILDAYWGRNLIHLHSEYMGVVVLMLAFAAFGTGATARAWRSVRLFWTGALIVALLWALGGFTPFYRLVYAVIPGTKYFRAPSTIFFIICFAFAVLAAIGTERLLAKELKARYAIVWLAAALLIAVLATAGFFGGIATSLASEQTVEVAQADAPAIIVGAWRSFLFVALAAALIMLAIRERVRPAVAAAVLAALVATDLWSVERLYWRFSPRASTLYASDATIDYVKRQPVPARVLAIPLGAGVAYRDPFLKGDALMLQDVRNVLGYHGNEIGRYQQLLGANQGYNQLFNPNVLQLLNAKFILTNIAELPLPGVQRVVGPVKNAAGTTVYLFEFQEERPAAWVTPVIVKAPDDAVYATVLNPAFDLRRAALFDTSATVRGQQITTVPERVPVAARVTRYEPGHISVELEQPAPVGAGLVVSENYYVGWSATADGRPAAIGRADYTMIGVELPTGSRRVELSFSDPAYRTGKRVTLIALALTGLLIVGGVVLERRRGG